MRLHSLNLSRRPIGGLWRKEVEKSNRTEGARILRPKQPLRERAKGISLQSASLTSLREVTNHRIHQV